MKKIAMLFFAAVLAAIVMTNLAYAADFSVNVSNVKDDITTDETAKFIAVIKSDSSKILEVKVYSPDVEWNVPEQIAKIGSNSKANVNIDITPTKYIGVGVYGVKINFKDEKTGEILEKILYVNVRPPGEPVSTYLPSINMEVVMPNVVDPSKEVKAVFEIENQNTLNLRDLVLKVKSDISEFNQQETFDLGSVPDRESIEIVFKPNSVQPPGEYKLNFEIYYNNKVIETADPKKIQISTVKPAYLEETSVDKISFIRTKTAVKYTSQSNVEDKQTKRFQMGIIQSAISYIDGYNSRMTKEDGKRYLAVDVELKPGETKTIYVITDYWIPLLVLIAAVLGSILYYVFRSPLRIRKGFTDIKLKEGGVSEMRVMLEIKNLTKENVRNVEVVDFVPHIADVSKQFFEGSLRPAKVLTHGGKGTILKWELYEVAGREDRVIVYSIATKLSIVGNFRMPRAKLVFKNEKGKNVHVYSNRIGVHS